MENRERKFYGKFHLTAVTDYTLSERKFGSDFSGHIGGDQFDFWIDWNDLRRGDFEGDPVTEVKFTGHFKVPPDWSDDEALSTLENYIGQPIQSWTGKWPQMFEIHYGEPQQGNPGMEKEEIMNVIWSNTHPVYRSKPDSPHHPSVLTLGEKGTTLVPLKTLTVPQLEALAKKHKIDLPGNPSGGQVVEGINLSDEEYKDFVDYLNTFKIQQFTAEDVSRWLKSRGNPGNPDPKRLGWGKQAFAEKPWGKGIVSLVKLIDPEAGDVWLVDYNDKSVGKGLLSTPDFNKAKKYFDSLDPSKSNPEKWAIYNSQEKGLWSNELGWVGDVQSADKFSDDEKDEIAKSNLPIGGVWIKVEDYRPQQGNPGGNPSRLDVIRRIKPILPLAQLQVSGDLFRGEEGDYFVELFDNLAKIFEGMPKPYQTESIPTENKIVHLHYFSSASDWYITERDTGEEQLQAFGYVILNGDLQNAEWGYVNIEELKKIGQVELDFHWKPKPFKEAMAEKNPGGNPGNPNGLQEVLEKEGDYIRQHGELTEADFSINDIQRDKIQAYWKLHPDAHIGLVNRYDRKRNFLQKYNGEKVLNFEWEFIIPQHDAELLKLLQAREQATYTGTEGDVRRLTPIWARIEQLGGLYLIWV